MKLITTASLAAALTGLAFLSAEARTMTVDAQDGNQVTLNFGGEDGSEYTLAVASGQADGGDDKYAWTDFERLATIATNHPHDHKRPGALSALLPDADREPALRARNRLHRVDGHAVY